MTGIDSYSTTPATNATADGGAVNWAEGQAPSTVNGTARQMLADTRSLENDRPWFQYGTGDQNTNTHLAVPAVYSSGTAFTITGADVTAKYETHARVRAVGNSTGTIYGTISSSSYSGGNTTTTVNVVWDSGSLSNETLTVSLSMVPPTGVPVPSSAISGTKTDDSAATGTVGEYVSANVLIGSAVSLVTLTAKTVTSISLTAGDWDVYGWVGFTGNASSITFSGCSTSLVHNTTGTFSMSIPAWAGNNNYGIAAPFQRVSISATTTVYLTAISQFSGGTATAYGNIGARRAR